MFNIIHTNKAHIFINISFSKNIIVLYKVLLEKTSESFLSNEVKLNEKKSIPIIGELAANIGSSWEKYISSMQIMMHANPLSNNFSPA